MLGTFGENTVKAQMNKLWREVIVVYKLGIAYNFGLYAETALENGACVGNLYGEFFGVGKAGKRVCERLSHKLNGSGICQTLEEVDKFGNIVLELFESYA